jgi:hypothetical protein
MWICFDHANALPLRLTSNWYVSSSHQALADREGMRPRFAWASRHAGGSDALDEWQVSMTAGTTRQPRTRSTSRVQMTPHTGLAIGMALADRTSARSFGHHEVPGMIGCRRYRDHGVLKFR